MLQAVVPGNGDNVLTVVRGIKKRHVFVIFTKVTLPSGPCESSLIQVQVLLSALKNSLEINVPGLLFFWPIIEDQIV